MYETLFKSQPAAAAPRGGKHAWRWLLLCALIIPGLLLADGSGSKRIEVYSLAQSYIDTRPGDTLSGIVAGLLPNNPGKHDSLAQEIVNLNPAAFIDNDPARMLAGKRLRLPGYVAQPDSRVDPGKYKVETFSWGNIKRPK